MLNGSTPLALGAYRPARAELEMLPCYTRRGFAGLEGLIALYRDYRHVTDSLFEKLPVAKVAIENSERDWPAYERSIPQALRLLPCCAS